MSASEIERRGDALLQRVGLDGEAADRRVGGYSGGMKRRLDLALALIHEPRILFLDEPTTGLDIQSRTAIWDEVARLARQEGVTVFLTTQYLEEADELADRVGIIDQGKLVAEGTPTELKAEIGRPHRRGVSRRSVRPRSRRVGAEPVRRGAPGTSRSRGRAAHRRHRGAWPRWSARSTPRASPSPTSSSTLRRSMTSSSPRPAARWRAPSDEVEEAEEQAAERGETDEREAVTAGAR